MKLFLVLTVLLTWEFIHGYTIQTRLGIIEGTESNLPEGKIYVFKKIPFAKPPVGNLRFRKPEPYGLWNSSLDARNFGPMCQQPQTALPMSEDCLYLNIYIPREISQTTRKAVMVWVHGGSYLTGSAIQYDGTPIAMLGDVIVVTINYRLGPIGFFSTGDSASPGNYGLWDQHMAFRWIHDNIEDYGGDPNIVTIFGESAGGGSVSFQSLYPGNKDLFQRVIAQSGVATSVGLRADNRVIVSEAQSMLQRLNCSLSTNEMSIDCLRQLPAATFLPEFYIIRTNNPVIDHDFVNGYAEKVLEDETSEVYKFFTSLDYMTGSLDGDGQVVVSALLQPTIASFYNINASVGFSFQILCDYFVPILTDLLLPNGVPASLNSKICAMYKNESSIVTQSNLLVDLYTDAFFTFPAHLSADFHYMRSKWNKSTYVYLMTRVNPIQTILYPGWTYGWMDRASHAMDVVYMFGGRQAFPNTEDQDFADTLIRYTTNFAKSGNPNGNNLAYWPAYDHQKNVQILDLRVETISNMLPERKKFWMESVYQDTILHQTQLGTLLGNARYLSGLGNIYEFLNIPFAKPPIGYRRFRKPEPYGSWQKTHNATQYGPSCMQAKAGLPPGLPNEDLSEDCLQLNILVPFNVSSDDSRSVMVWIHGGGYIAGQAFYNDRTSLALRGNVIVVSINYRLGPFGFFSTNDSASPGNYGLWDQHLALKWVHDNIADFGGDPGSVTIFGESAGGGSVSFQMFYPGNQGLFQKVIAQSGVAFFLRADQSTVRQVAGFYISFHNCSASNNSESVECLRGLPAEALVEGGYFAPSIDGEFVVGYAEEVLQNRDSDIYKFYTSLDYMTGILNGDGAISIKMYMPETLLNAFNLSYATGMTTDFLCSYVANSVSTTFKGNKNALTKRICDIYSNNTSVAAQSNAIVDIYSDFGFTMPAFSSADFHLSGMNSKTYMFLMTRANQMQISIFPEWTFPWTDQAVHAMDLFYLFSPDDLLVTLNQTEDIELGHKMQQYWSNFAKTSNPNGPDLPFWPQYDHQRRIQVLDVQIKTETDIYPDRRKFWMDTALKEDIILQTRLGYLLGKKRFVSGLGTIYEFLNIPFAKPPIGSRRFRKPEPYGSWQGTRNATQYGPSCMQAKAGLPPGLPNEDLSEDCLQLNILVPFNVSSDDRRSVMVWIHGGGYIAGQSFYNDRTSLALRGNVIVVSINYRLGPFGFFSTNDSASPGNYGLWDQHLALKWVHDNIADFGGDPGSVTVFGGSAGGRCVSFQMFYPGNQGLFQKVITQSGVAFFLRGDQSRVRQFAGFYISYHNCSRRNNSESVECLRGLPAEALVEGGYFSPTIDGEFVIGYAEEVLQNRDSDVYKFYTSLDYMTGILNGDGAISIKISMPETLLNAYNLSYATGMTTDFLCSYVANSVSTTFKGNKNALTKRICEIYSNNTSVAAQSNAIVDIYSDFGFTMPAFSSADFHLSGMNSKTYMFLMTRANQMQISILPERTFPWTDQAVHAMELFYLFSPDDLFVALNQTEDIELGHKMQQYWSNFAKTSNPNGPDLPFWPQYDHQRRIQVLDVQIKTETDIYPDRMKLWMDTAQREDIILQTRLGSLLGKKRFVSGLGTIYEFLNIPFAKPPIGSLRFRKPEPYGSWQGTLNATQYGPSCMQDKLGLPSGLANQDVSEDCLHLNIYVPYRLSNESSHAKSVVVWVHGGGYSGGQGSFYDGTSLALRGDVIVVTINYRLGPFGFFSTNDSASPGNYGLWDQHLAFKWVHDNIATFGGDPGSVTIFGESAGGGSVSFQMLYPGNQGLFQKVISQSGVAFSSVLRTNQSYVKPIAGIYISFHNCSSSNTSISVECLRNLTAEELLKGGAFTPVIDGEFVMGYAEDVMQNRNSDIYRFYTSIDYMSGILDGDGAITMVYVITEPVLNSFNLSMATGLTTDILCGYVANYISESLYRNKSEVAKGVCDLYSNTTSIVAQSNAIVDLFSDVTFTMPALMSSDLRPSGGNAKRTYMFMMPRVNPRQQVLYPSWTYSWTDRAVHAMDLFYLFSPDDLLVTFNQTEDIELGHKMQQYWSNFAKTSDPNGPGLPFWPQYNTKRHIQILDIPISTETNFYPKRTEFWMTTVPNIMEERQDGGNGGTVFSRSNIVCLDAIVKTVCLFILCCHRLFM